tara:strand:- start:63 stop:416 length:354 start_codon:yes stop_codon:yes gene_type:complete
MDVIAPEILQDILVEDLDLFRKYIMEANPIEFSEYSSEKIFSLYIFSVLDNMSALKQVKDKCIKSKKISEKEFNKFIYLSMKYIDKLNIKKWSWFEIDQLNIDVDDIQSTTLTYTIL